MLSIDFSNLISQTFLFKMVDIVAEIGEGALNEQALALLHTLHTNKDLYLPSSRR